MSYTHHSILVQNERAYPVTFPGYAVTNIQLCGGPFQKATLFAEKSGYIIDTLCGALGESAFHLTAEERGLPHAVFHPLFVRVWVCSGSAVELHYDIYPAHISPFAHMSYPFLRRSQLKVGVLPADDTRVPLFFTPTTQRLFIVTDTGAPHPHPHLQLEVAGHCVDIPFQHMKDGVWVVDVDVSDHDAETGHIRFDGYSSCDTTYEIWSVAPNILRTCSGMYGLVYS
jgi:hypothetical protein